MQLRFSVESVEATVRYPVQQFRAAEIDERIRIRTEHWRIPRMAVVDRNLLRMAVYEFLHQSNTPRTVAINEALEIARRFSTNESTQFINGILDAIKRDLDTQAGQEVAAIGLVQRVT